MSMDTETQPQFVHLHCHSHYSLLDGLTKIPDLVVRAKELGMTAIALTDHGTMYGAIEFYKMCKKHDIKPIIGVEAYMAERTRFDKDASLDTKRYHLTLLAKNNAGYHNLIKLVSRAAIEGFYHKPRMDEQLLQEFSEGIICLTGSPSGRFVQALRNNNLAEARRLLKFYIDTFGKENVFVEIMYHKEIEWYMSVVPMVQQMATEFDLPIVGTWDSHYLHKEDNEAHATLLAINTNNNEFKTSGDYSLLSPAQAMEVFRDIPSAV
jgi:DNA polymerase III subunit alpha